MADLKNRVALVLGGAGGIGLASCRALAAEGAAVVIADRDGDAAEQAASGLRAEGMAAAAVQVEFASIPELEAAFAFVAREHGKLDVLFSNVGTRGPNGFDVTEAQFDDVMRLNLKNHFFATTLALPLMRPCAPHASIIYMSSGAGMRFFGRSPLYSISKAGLIMLARTFARQLGPEGIRANALCPGAVDTAFPRAGIASADHLAAAERWSSELPLRRIAEPEDVADVVAFLASDRSRYLTGLAIPVDGGLFA